MPPHFAQVKSSVISSSILSSWYSWYPESDYFKEVIDWIEAPYWTNQLTRYVVHYYKTYITEQKDYKPIWPHRVDITFA